MGPDWSIVDSDEFEMEDDKREEEEEEEEEVEEAEIYRGQKLKKIILPRHLVKYSKNFANGDVDFLKLAKDEHEEELDEEEARKEEEDNEEEEEQEREDEEDEEDGEEDDEEDEEEESYREGQVFKSLLMLARYKSSEYTWQSKT